MGAWEYACSKTTPWRASASSCGVKPCFEPRKPMRSARTVSKVIRITLGWSLAAAASAGNRRKRQRMQARRIKEKGACIVADSLFGTKAWSRRLENELRPDLRSARAALRKERVTGGDIRRLRILGEATAPRVGAARERIEVRMVQQVKDLESELEAHPFRDLGGLDEVKIQLPESGSAERVAATGHDSVVGRSGKYRGRIRDGGTTGVTELINRFYSRTVWPFVDPVLAGSVGVGAQQWRKGTPSQSRHHRPDLPTLSQAPQ